MSTADEITDEVDPRYVRLTNEPRLIADTTTFCEATRRAPKIPFEQTLADTLDYWRGRLRAGTG